MTDSNPAAAKINLPPGAGFLAGLSTRFWFWIILGAGFLTLQGIHNDIDSDWVAGILAAIVIGIGIMLLRGVAKFEVLPLLYKNWKKILGWFAIYLVAGFLFVGIKWTADTWRWSNAYQNELVRFKSERGLTSNDQLVGTVLKDWQSRYLNDPRIGYWPDPLSERVQTQYRRHLIAWPWSATQWAFGDLLNTILDWVMNSVTKMMVAISDFFTGDLPGLRR